MRQQLELFTERLPKRPYCTDNLNLGLVIRPKLQAIEKRYIQPNGPHRKYWIVVDVDRPGGGHDWQLLEAPAPNLVAENRENLHAHLFYGLGIPVHTNPEAQIKPLRYAAAVEWGLVEKLDGDLGYAGLVAKNPLSDAWKVETYQDRLYDLDWLADYVELGNWQDRRRHLADYGLGRNCTLFERLRRWSYKAIRVQGWPGYDQWYRAVLLEAGEYNDFQNVLPIAEVRATARSVARWTWRTMSAAGFSAWQRHVNAVRWGDQAERRRQLLLDFLEEHQDASRWAASRATGTPWTTTRRLLERPADPISDPSTGRLVKSGSGRLGTRQNGQDKGIHGQNGAGGAW